MQFICNATTAFACSPTVRLVSRHQQDDVVRCIYKMLCLQPMLIVEEKVAITTVEGSRQNRAKLENTYIVSYLFL